MSEPGNGLAGPAPAPARGRRARETVPGRRAPEGQRIAFLESNATGSGYEAILAAKARGCHVTFVTRDLGYYQRPGLLPFPMDGVDRVITCETNDADAIAAALAPLAGELSALISVGEWYMQAAADAAALLGFKGQRPAAVRACRDKSLTRTLCAAAGVPGPRFAVVTTPEGARRAEVGFPRVVKPVDDSMSHGVRLCRDAGEAAGHAAALLSDTHNIRGQRKAPAVLVEEYLPGPEVSVEALVSRGQVRPVMVTEKLLAAPPGFIETGHVLPARLEEPARRACLRVVAQALAAIGYDFGAVHAECRLTPDGPKIVEINCRLPGGQITRLVKLATGLDMTAALIDMYLGRPPPPAPAARLGAAIRFLLGRAGTVESVHGTDGATMVAGVREVCVLARPGATLRDPASNADRIGYVIATGATGDAALRAACAAAAAVRVEVAGPARVPAGGPR
jgi:biotin carboxylase